MRGLCADALQALLAAAALIATLVVFIMKKVMLHLLPPSKPHQHAAPWPWRFVSPSGICMLHSATFLWSR